MEDAERAHQACEAIEQLDVQSIALERQRRGRLRLQPFSHERRLESGEVDPERHRDHVRAVFDGPLDRTGDAVAAAAVVADDLADKRLLYAPGNADPDAVDVAAEDRSGAVSAVSVLVAVALARKVFLHELDAGERGMRSVDAGIQYGDDNAGAVERGCIGANGVNT